MMCLVVFVKGKKVLSGDDGIGLWQWIFYFC